MPTAGNETVQVRLSAREWATVDATVDNVVAVAAVELDEVTVTRGRAIRQAGWDQVPWVDGDWPPMEQNITIDLRDDQWRWTVVQLRQSCALNAEIGERESERLGREALAALSRQLDEA